MEREEIVYDIFTTLVDESSKSKRFYDTSSLKGSLGILIYLSNRKGEEVIQTDISKKLNISNPRVTFAIKCLLNKGFIKKYRSTEDSRKIIIMITSKGEEYIKNKTSILINQLNDKLKPLTQEECEQLNVLLRKLLKD